MEQLDDAALIFPVLAIGSRPGVLGVYSTRDQMTACTVEALKEGYFAGMLLVERSGRSFRVVGVREIEPKGGLFGWTPFHGRITHVGLQLTGEGQVRLEDLKQEMLSKLEEARDVWEEAGEFDEISAGVQGAKAIEELFRSDLTPPA